MRQKKDKLNPKTMELEQPWVLTCPHCGEEEVLKGAREDTYIRVNVVIATRRGAKGTEQISSHPKNDICSRCAASLMEWVNRPASSGGL